MKKLLFIISILTLATSLSTLTTSCSEIEEVGEYDNWKERNQAYIDSIANLANSNKDGWKKIVAYNLNDSVENAAGNTNHFIYVQKIGQGTGTYQPQFKDSVRVHYMGRLIPSENYAEGLVFDKSYSKNTLNEATDVPALLGVSGTVVGFSTALQYMVVGDSWRVVIPYYLGYGGEDSGKIPAYSALIFDIKLARTYRLGIDTNTSWR